MFPHPCHSPEGAALSDIFGAIYMMGENPVVDVEGALRRGSAYSFELGYTMGSTMTASNQHI